jgi:large subunit ribosomal protein L6
MSRIGKMPVVIPSGVKVQLNDSDITVEGPKGKLNWQIPVPIKAKIEDNRVIVTRPTDNRNHKALHGLTRSLIQNMVDGVSKGFEKELMIEGVGYRAELKNKNIILSIGFSHPVEIEPPEGIKFEVPEPTRIKVLGIDKKLVGEIAAQIRRIRKADCYKAKGLRYVGEYIRRKAGKIGAK